MKMVYKSLVLFLAAIAASSAFAAHRGSGHWQKKIDTPAQVAQPTAHNASKRALKKRGVRHIKVPS